MDEILSKDLSDDGLGGSRGLVKPADGDDAAGVFLDGSRLLFGHWSGTASANRQNRSDG